MAFWGVEVKPGKPFTLKATNDATGIKRLHISQATLGLGNEQTSRSILQCNVGNTTPLFLCVLSPLKVDSCQLNLEFEEAEDVMFSVIGPLSVHLTGYFLGRSSNAFRLNDEESESFGEDIAGTDGEKGSSDDYDYSDSFIDDDDPSARGSDVSSTDDDEITVKERAAKTKEKKQNKKGGEGKMRFQVFHSDVSSTDDDEITVKERAAKTKEMKRNKKGGERKMRFQVFHSDVSSTDDDEITVKERAAKTKEKKQNKKGGEGKMRFQVFHSDSDDTSARADDSASEDSVEILHNDNDHKIPKVPLPSRVTRSKAKTSTLENGETDAKCEKTSEATTDTDKTLDKREDKKGSEVLSKKKRNKESVVISESQKPPSDKAIETSTDVLPSQNGEATLSKKKRKRDRKEETKERKKQAMDNAENTEKELDTKKLPENSSDEVKIEEIEKGKVDGKVAVQGKKVSILYTAKLKDTGKLIDSNLDEGPFKFRLGGEKVIKGLSIGVEGMRVGDKRRLIIPPSLGYSEEGLKKESVPKNAWLVYEVEAVKVR